MRREQQRYSVSGLTQAHGAGGPEGWKTALWTGHPCNGREAVSEVARPQGVEG
jgi:hypothetical protein